MTVHLSIRDRIRDEVALYDITHQSARSLVAIFHQRLRASSDGTETEYWQARIAGVEEAAAALRSNTPPMQILALQERWTAEADILDPAGAGR